MKTKFRFILTVVVSLQIIACLSIPLAPKSDATPTPTYVIGAQEATPVDTNELPTKAGTDCFGNLKQTVGDKVLCIQGTYESHYDVTTSSSPEKTNHVVSPLSARFYLWTVAPGQLQGTAHVTYSLNATYIDNAETASCKVQTEIVKPFSWDVKLDGKYFTQPDGGIQIFVQATPPQGPSYNETFEDCPIPEKEAPGITWATLGGKLFGGVYDHRQDNPLPADSRGEFYVVIHMVIVQ